MQKIIFLHVTKTAGGSLKGALEKLQGRKVAVCNGSKDVKNVSKDVDLLFGHMVYGVHNDFHKDAKYMAFVRHPLSRTISHFYQLANVDKSHIGEKIQKYQDINEFFLLDHHWEFENFLCKILSGEISPSMGDFELYQKAQKTIEERYEFIGIQEFMQLSMLRLSRILNEDLKIEKNINIGQYKLFDIDASTIDKILERNQADMMLYENLVSRFLPSIRKSKL